MTTRSRKPVRAYHLAILGLVLLCCTAYSTCQPIVNYNPSRDQTVAANANWIVTGMNFKWNIVPAPGSVLASTGYKTWTFGPGYFAGNPAYVPVTGANGLFPCINCFVTVPPPTPCPGLSLAGEPQVVADPLDGRLWFHINDGGFGCLFATTAAGDPRGPFVPGIQVALGDGLHLNVTSDKIVVVGYIPAPGDPCCGSGCPPPPAPQHACPAGGGGYVVSRADMVNGVRPPAMQTIYFDSDAPNGWAIINRSSAAPSVAWYYSPHLTDPTAVQLKRIDGVPPTATLTIYEASTSSTIPFGRKPFDGIQPDTTRVTFPNSTPGMWASGSFGFIVQSTPGPEGIYVDGIEQIWLYAIGPLDSGIPFIEPYYVDQGPGANFSDASTWYSGPASMGCPTLGVRPDNTVVLGISAVGKPGQYLSAYRRLILPTPHFGTPGGDWALIAQGKGPSPSPAPICDTSSGVIENYCIDFCTAAASVVDPKTICQVQPYYDAGQGGYDLTDATSCYDGNS